MVGVITKIFFIVTIMLVYSLSSIAAEPKNNRKLNSGTLIETSISFEQQPIQLQHLQHGNDEILTLQEDKIVDYIVPHLNSNPGVYYPNRYGNSRHIERDIRSMRREFSNIDRSIRDMNRSIQRIRVPRGY